MKDFESLDMHSFKLCLFAVKKVIWLTVVFQKIDYLKDL